MSTFNPSRKASERRNRPVCPWCDQYVRRGVEQHQERCQRRPSIPRVGDPGERHGDPEFPLCCWSAYRYWYGNTWGFKSTCTLFKGGCGCDCHRGKVSLA